MSALISAIITVAVAFGADINDQQRDAILTAGGALCLAMAAIGPVVRGFVVSPQTAANAVVMAKQDTAPTNEVPAINMASGAYTEAVNKLGYSPGPPAAN